MKQAISSSKQVPPTADHSMSRACSLLLCATDQARPFHTELDHGPPPPGSTFCWPQSRLCIGLLFGFVWILLFGLWFSFSLFGLFFFFFYITLTKTVIPFRKYRNNILNDFNHFLLSQFLKGTDVPSNVKSQSATRNSATSATKALSR